MAPGTIRSVSTTITFLGAALIAVLLAGCSAQEIHPAKMPLSKSAMKLLGKKGMSARAPIFIRIFKEESELEVWKQKPDGHFYHFKTYPICTWSGKLGPKFRQGDKQAPEGFYNIKPYLMNPNSKYHLAFNLGYPNAYDKAHGRTGNFLMVHGKCSSAGCYAMTDALIEEIYALARDALAGGQKSFQVHAFPFRMTEENMTRHAGHRAMPFWRMLKVGYDDFELTRIPPKIDVCERRYLVNVNFLGSRRPKLRATSRCPRYQRASLVPFLPTQKKAQQLASQRVTAPGIKQRRFVFVTPTGTTGKTGSVHQGLRTGKKLSGKRYYGLGATQSSR